MVGGGWYRGVSSRCSWCAAAPRFGTAPGSQPVACVTPQPAARPPAAHTSQTKWCVLSCAALSETRSVRPKSQLGGVSGQARTVASRRQSRRHHRPGRAPEPPAAGRWLTRPPHRESCGTRVRPQELQGCVLRSVRVSSIVTSAGNPLAAARTQRSSRRTPAWKVCVREGLVRGTAGAAGGPHTSSVPTTYGINGSSSSSCRHQRVSLRPQLPAWRALPPARSPL